MGTLWTLKRIVDFPAFAVVPKPIVCVTPQAQLDPGSGQLAGCTALAVRTADPRHTLRPDSTDDMRRKRRRACKSSARQTAHGPTDYALDNLSERCTALALDADRLLSSRPAYNGAQPGLISQLPLVYL